MALPVGEEGPLVGSLISGTRGREVRGKGVSQKFLGTPRTEGCGGLRPGKRGGGDGRTPVRR